MLTISANGCTSAVRVLCDGLQMSICSDKREIHVAYDYLYSESCIPCKCIFRINTLSLRKGINSKYALKERVQLAK